MKPPCPLSSLLLVALTLIVTFPQIADALGDRGILLSVQSVTLLPKYQGTDLEMDRLDIHLGLAETTNRSKKRMVSGFRQQITEGLGAILGERIPVENSFYLPAEAFDSGICVDVRVTERKFGHIGSGCAALSMDHLGETQKVTFDIDLRVKLEMEFQARSINVFSSEEGLERAADGVILKFHRLRIPHEIIKKQGSNSIALHYSVYDDPGDRIGSFGDTVYWRDYLLWWLPPNPFYLFERFPPNQRDFTELDDVIVLEAEPKKINVVLKELRPHLVPGRLRSGYAWDRFILRPDPKTNRRVKHYKGYELEWELYRFQFN